MILLQLQASMGKMLGIKPADKIKLTVPKQFLKDKEILMRKVLAKKVIFGKELKVSL